MDEQNKTVQPEAAAAPESRPLKKPAPAKDEAPRRRVGSFTLGISLIAAGILFLCYYFVPGFDWQLVLKVAPAAGLVLLGGEVLWFASHPGRWKYDFVSVLVCLLLMGVCLCMGFVPLIAEQYGPERQQTANRLSQTYTDTLYQDLKAEAPDVQLEDVYTDLYLYTSTVQDLADLDGRWQPAPDRDPVWPLRQCRRFCQRLPHSGGCDPEAGRAAQRRDLPV